MNNITNNQSIQTLIRQINEIPLPNMRGQHENAKRNYPELKNELLSIKNYDELSTFLDTILQTGTKEEKVALKNILNGLSIKSIKNKKIYGLVEIVKLNLNRQIGTYTNNTRTRSNKPPKSRKSRKTRKNRK